MKAQKKMKKYGVRFYDDAGELLHEQELWGTKDYQSTLPHANKNFPDWFKITIVKKGFVEDYER